MLTRIEAAGLMVHGVHGSYRGGPWTTDSSVWLIQARKAARASESAYAL